MSKVELYHGDCLDIMPTLEAESVQLVVTSPPYGDMYSDMSVDECKALIQAVVLQCERVLAPGGKFAINVNNYVTSRANGWRQRQIIPMTQWVQEACELIYQDEIFWIKGLAQGSRGKPLFGSYPYPPNFLMAQRVEYVLVWAKEGKRQVDKETKEASRLTKEEWREWTQNAWAIVGANRNEHPAPFPYELPMRLIRLYSFVGDTVLDPFTGTATTGQVCVHTGRNFVGIEIDPTYFDIAKGSIEAAQSEMVQVRMVI